MAPTRIDTETSFSYPYSRGDAHVCEVARRESEDAAPLLLLDENEQTSSGIFAVEGNGQPVLIPSPESNECTRLSRSVPRGTDVPHLAIDLDPA